MQWEETFDAIPPTTEIKTGHNYDNKNSTLAFFAAKYCAQPLFIWSESIFHSASVISS